MNSTYSTLILEHINKKIKPMKTKLIQPIQPSFINILTYTSES